MSESSEPSSVTKVVKDIDEKLKELVSLMSTHCISVDKLEDQFLGMRAVVGDLEIENLLLPETETQRTLLSELLRQLHRANEMFHHFFIKEEVCPSIFSLPRRLAFDPNRRREIRNIIQVLDGIRKGKEWKILESRLLTESIKRVNKMKQGTTNFATELAEARKDDKQKIIKRLLESSPSSNSSGNVQVLTIFGPKGIGKSSLARTIFDDSKIVDEFKSLRVWVYVGEKFDVKTIVKKLVECLVESRIEDLGTEKQKELLRELFSLKKKKFLLVLDDFPTEGDNRKWDELMECLKGDVDGNRIIVVTREDVGISTLEKYKLEGLSLNNSIWDLDPPEDKSKEFTVLKNEIISKCDHRPLDVEIIGKLLRYRPLKTELLPFMREVLGKLNDPALYSYLPPLGKLDGLALPLSYSYLPPQLQQCFVYCGLFPKNEFIDVEKLIHHWIAHQYVIKPEGAEESKPEGAEESKPAGAEESVEEIGLQYFNYLVRRSFLKEGERDELGNVRSCVLDGSVHALAASMADCHMVKNDAEFKTSGEIKSRHVSCLFHLNSKLTEKCFFGANRVRTFLLPRQEILRTNEGAFSESFVQEMITAFRKSFAQEMITKFQHLYVCDLHSSGIVKVPSCIQNLECLRYLDISDNDEIKFLPKAITNLRYLQVLNVSGCAMLEKLPKNIRKLVDLRHLYCHKCWNLKYMPRGIGDLTQLRTLSWFVVAEDASLFAHIGGLEELGGLQNLREVEIRNLKHLNWGTAECEKAKPKEKVGKAECEKAKPKEKVGKAECEKAKPQEKVGKAESEEANPKEKVWTAECEKAKLKEKLHLQSLTLRWNHDEDDNDDDVTDVVDFDRDLELNENLKRLKVRDYKGETFPVGFSSLTSLVHISIKNCPRCVRLPALDHITTLKCLSLENLPRLAYVDDNTRSDVAVFKSLEQLQLLSCPNLKKWSQPKNQNQNENESDWQVLGVEQFPVLSSTKIEHCPNFKSKFPEAEEKPTLDSASADGQLPLAEVQRELSRRGKNIRRASAVLRDILQQSTPANISRSAAKWNTVLTIRDAESFPEKLLKNLSYYQTLVIHHCPKMLSLPQSLKHCTSLRHLKISDCPQLEARCGSQEGADWHIIAHIPFIEINSQFIKRNGQFLSHDKTAPVAAAPITTTPSEATRDNHSVEGEFLRCAGSNYSRPIADHHVSRGNCPRPITDSHVSRRNYPRPIADCHISRHNYFRQSQTATSADVTIPSQSHTATSTDVTTPGQSQTATSVDVTIPSQSQTATSTDLTTPGQS